MLWIYSSESGYTHKNTLQDTTNDNVDLPFYWYEDFIIQEEYHLAHQQYSYIVQLILSIKNNEVMKIRSILKKINKERWVLSYHSYLSLFFTLIEYHLAENKSERDNLLNQYNTLCKDLNYPIFDKNYLKNYFK